VTRPARSDRRGAPDARPDLRADCSRCFALCCVVPAFAASADFAVTKPAGVPCPQLSADHRCTIHARLRERGFAGCTVYDCFGAGQRVSQVTVGGRDPRADAAAAGAVAEAFPAVRALHELLWYLTEARALAVARPVHDGLADAFARIDALAGAPPAELAALDLEAVRRDVDPLLREVSRLAREQAARRSGRHPGRLRPGADLRGADLRGADLRGADLRGADVRGADLRGADVRGACLIGVDLRRADLRGADLIGVDLRAADVRGAQLAGCLFVTQPQLAAARGDGATTVPVALSRPTHWDR
jgi:Pentapeptide repeats (8 copies)